MSSLEYDMVEAGRRIRCWQRDAGIKGFEIARDAGISAPYYSDIANGRQRGSIPVLARIVAVLGKRLDDLFEPETDLSCEGTKPQHLKRINPRALRNRLRPYLGAQSDEFVECLEMWTKAPKQLKRALRAFLDGKDAA